MSLRIRLVIFAVFFLTVSVLLSTLKVEGQAAYWYSLIPALLAVGLAFATHNIYLSLGLAVLIGGPLAKLADADSLTQALTSGVSLSFSLAKDSLLDWTNIQILIFASFVLIMIGVIQGAGGFHALADRLSKYATGKKSTKFMTFLLGLAVFIDDYASTMIVGSSMRPLSDRAGISREKLAFLVDATSAPIAGLAVVSTWIGYEVGLFGQVSESLKLGQNGYAMFFDAISFRFYCVFMLIFIIVNIFSGIDFGPMRKAEENAKPIAPNNRGANAQVTGPNALIWVAIIPFAGLMLYLFAALWFDGKGDELMLGFGSIFSLDYWRTVLSQSENNILILAKASVLGLFLSLLLSIVIAKSSISSLLGFLKEGGKRAMLPVVILVLAWSLKSICTELKTGIFLAALLGDVIRPEFFPMCLFLVASLIAISTGTSWGTMAILIPTAIPLAYHLDGNVYGTVTMISLGAILDGAILGDHCSPISDTTILSSMSSECDHMSHVKTQMPYSLVVGLFAMVFGYLPAAFGYGWFTSFSMATISTIGLFWILKRKRTAATVN